MRLIFRCALSMDSVQAVYGQTALKNLSKCFITTLVSDEATPLDCRTKIAAGF